MKQSKWENGEWYNLNFAECDKEELLDLHDHIKTEKDEIEFQISIKNCGEDKYISPHFSSRWLAKATIAFKKRGVALDRVNRQLNKLNRKDKSSYHHIFVASAKEILEENEFQLIHKTTLQEMEEV